MKNRTKYSGLKTIHRGEMKGVSGGRPPVPPPPFHVNGHKSADRTLPFPGFNNGGGCYGGGGPNEAGFSMARGTAPTYDR